MRKTNRMIANNCAGITITFVSILTRPGGWVQWLGVRPLRQSHRVSILTRSVDRVQRQCPGSCPRR